MRLTQCRAAGHRPSTLHLCNAATTAVNMTRVWTLVSVSGGATSKPTKEHDFTRTFNSLVERYVKRSLNKSQSQESNTTTVIVVSIVHYYINSAPDAHDTTTTEQRFQTKQKKKRKKKVGDKSKCQRVVMPQSLPQRARRH